MQDHLGVATGMKPHAFARQLVAKRGVVVDLAIEDDCDATLPEHRLRSTADIDDRQAPVTQSHSAVVGDENALAVRTAMLERVAHPDDKALGYAAGAMPVLENPCNATHSSNPRPLSASDKRFL